MQVLPAPSGGDELSAFLQLSPDGVVVVDRAGCITTVNDRAGEMFGWPPAELAGHSVEDLVPGPRRTRHEGLRERYQVSPHTRAMGAGLDLAAARRDGTRFPVDISLTAYTAPDGAPLVIAVIRDMTEQRRRDRDTARLAALVQSSDAAMLSIDPEQRVDSWNPGAQLAFGYRADEIVGRDVMTLVPEGVQGETRALYERAASGERVEFFDAPRLHQDGHEVPMGITLSAMRDATGAFIGWSEVMRDRTERVRLHARLAAAEADRQVLADRERIARDLHDVVIQRIFAAGMGLQGLASTIDPQTPTHERLARIITELDTAVREIRTSIFTIRQQPGDVATLRGRVLDIGTEMTAALGFRPTFDFRGPIDLVVTGDVGDAVVAVVHEGLANIAKHAQATEARVRVLADPTSVRVIVADDGIGMPSSGRRSGVANMAARANQLGGSLQIEGGPDGGTTLTMTLPIAWPSAAS
jgi:two-component system sensor histidine kinase DevS